MTLFFLSQFIHLLLGSFVFSVYLLIMILFFKVNMFASYTCVFWRRGMSEEAVSRCDIDAEGLAEVSEFNP